MNNLLAESRSVLENAGFSTFASRPDAPFFHFEDASVLGIVRVFETVEILIAEAQTTQDSFLQTSAKMLALDPFKAWNAYTVLLAQPMPTPDQTRQLFELEEDFRATRKIARAGFRSRSDLASALASLLPLQQVLSIALTDERVRLVERLGPTQSPMQALVTDKATAEEIAASLGKQP